MWLFTLWWWNYWSCGLRTAIIFVMPLVFNIFNGYSAGTGHLSWYLTNTKSSSSTVPKISRVILSLLLGSHHLRPACMHIKNRVIGKNGCGQFTNIVRSFTDRFPIIQALGVEVSTDLLACWSMVNMKWHFERAKQGMVSQSPFLLNFSLIITWSLRMLPDLNMTVLPGEPGA